MHAETERTPRELLPDIVAQLLERHDQRRAARREAWRQHIAADRAREAAYERFAQRLVHPRPRRRPGPRPRTLNSHHPRGESCSPGRRAASCHPRHCGLRADSMSELRWRGSPLAVCFFGFGRLSTETVSPGHYLYWVGVFLRRDFSTRTGRRACDSRARSRATACLAGGAHWAVCRLGGDLSGQWQLASMQPQLIPTVLGAAGGLVGGALSMVGKVPETLMQAGSQLAGTASQSLGGLMKQGLDSAELGKASRPLDTGPGGRLRPAARQPASRARDCAPRRSVARRHRLPLLPQPAPVRPHRRTLPVQHRAQPTGRQRARARRTLQVLRPTHRILAGHAGTFLRRPRRPPRQWPIYLPKIPVVSYFGARRHG